VFGKERFNYVSIESILLVLRFVEYGFGGIFPRLSGRFFHRTIICRTDSRNAGELCTTQGIVVLSILAEAAVFFFGGITDDLIPLYAVWAFPSGVAGFSQAGMVVAGLVESRVRTGYNSRWLTCFWPFVTGTVSPPVVVFVAKFVMARADRCYLFH